MAQLPGSAAMLLLDLLSGVGLSSSGFDPRTHRFLIVARKFAPNSAWQMQDAKARFSELLAPSLKEGPQVVTRRGVPSRNGRRLQRLAQPTFKDLLLGEGPRFEAPVPPRRAWRHRPPLRVYLPNSKA
jgi:antitoxin Phd